MREVRCSNIRNAGFVTVASGALAVVSFRPRVGARSVMLCVSWDRFAERFGTSSWFDLARPKVDAAICRSRRILSARCRMCFGPAFRRVLVKRFCRAEEGRERADRGCELSARAFPGRAFGDVVLPGRYAARAFDEHIPKPDKRATPSPRGADLFGNRQQAQLVLRQGSEAKLETRMRNPWRIFSFLFGLWVRGYDSRRNDHVGADDDAELGL